MILQRAFSVCRNAIPQSLYSIAPEGVRGLAEIGPTDIAKVHNMAAAAAVPCKLDPDSSYTNGLWKNGTEDEKIILPRPSRKATAYSAGAKHLITNKPVMTF